MTTPNASPQSSPDYSDPSDLRPWHRAILDAPENHEAIEELVGNIQFREFGNGHLLPTEILRQEMQKAVILIIESLFEDLDGMLLTPAFCLLLEQVVARQQREEREERERHIMSQDFGVKQPNTASELGAQPY